MLRKSLGPIAGEHLLQVPVFGRNIRLRGRGRDMPVIGIWRGAAGVHTRAWLAYRRIEGLSLLDPTECSVRIRTPGPFPGVHMEHRLRPNRPWHAKHNIKALEIDSKEGKALQPLLPVCFHDTERLSEDAVDQKSVAINE